MIAPASESRAKKAELRRSKIDKQRSLFGEIFHKTIWYHQYDMFKIVFTHGKLKFRSLCFISERLPFR